jgi:hypothetical protein
MTQANIAIRAVWCMTMKPQRLQAQAQARHHPLTQLKLDSWITYCSRELLSAWNALHCCPPLCPYRLVRCTGILNAVA